MAGSRAKCRGGVGGWVGEGGGRAGVGKGGGAAVQFLSHCSTLVAVIIVGGVFVVVVVLLFQKKKKKTKKKQAERDDDVTGGAQHSGKQLSHFGSRSTFWAAAVEKEMSSERKPV